MGSKVKQGELSILDAKPKQDENKQMYMEPRPIEKEIPYNHKNKVYDEWGALAKQQDMYAKEYKIIQDDAPAT